MSGYIYIRTNNWWDVMNLCKLGKTSNIINRTSTYITGEPIPGIMKMVLELDILLIDEVELKLQNHFSYLNVYNGGGIEFFKCDIIQLILPYLNNIHIKYRELTLDEIDELDRKAKLRNTKHEINNTIIPKQHQQEVLDRIYQHYEKNDKGTILWACGMGKSLLSIFIIKLMNFRNVLIGVPSKDLQNQFIKEIKSVFINCDILSIGSNNTIDATTDMMRIEKHIKNPTHKYKFIITTYASCHLLTPYTFDFKIGDEAHHLTGNEKEEAKQYVKFHRINSKKSLFMTATEKDICDHIMSMDNTDIFGDIIDTKTIGWAINNKRITDYKVVIIKNTPQEIDDLITYFQIKCKNKEIFIASAMLIKCMQKYPDMTHVLVYTNSTENADLFISYIEEILNKYNRDGGEFNISDYYINSIHSNKKYNFEDEVRKINISKFSIITTVYSMAEGINLPILKCSFVAVIY
jgi:predicted helicase